MSSTCPICFETFHGRIKARPEVCNHVFCLPCLETWGKTDGVCPIDRMKFRNIINLESFTTIQIKPRKRKHKRDLYDVSIYCEICKGNSDTFLLCDCCDLAFHGSCLTPPLTHIPAGRWHCPDCVAVESRLRANRGTTADRRISAKYLRKRRKRRGRPIRKDPITRKLTIHFSETRHSQRPTASASLGDSLTTERTPEIKNESLSDKCGSSYSQHDVQPGPSRSSTSAWEHTSPFLEDDFNFSDSDFNFSNSDFDTSSSDESELDNIIDDFHQQEKLSNTATFKEEVPSSFVDEDEFQDYDFDGFDGFSSSENESGEASTSNQEKDSNTLDDKLIPPVVSSEPCSTKVGVTNVPTENTSKYKQTENGCYLASPKTMQNPIDVETKPEDSSQNNPTVSGLISSSSERDFMKSLIKDKDLNKAIGSCVISSSEKSGDGIAGVINSEESLHAKLNNPTVNNCNFSSNKIAILKNLNEVRFTESGCYLAPPENAIGVRKKPEEISLAIPNTTVNNCNSSSNKIAIIKNLNEVQFTESGCYLASHENAIGVRKKLEDISLAKQNTLTVNNFNSSSPKSSFMKSLIKDRDINAIYSCNVSFENSQNEINCAIKSEESSPVKQNPIINHSNSINSCRMSSSKLSQNEMDAMIESEGSLHGKQNNPTTNYFNSLSPKRNLVKSLKEAEDFNQKIDGAIVREKDSLAKWNNPTISNVNSSPLKKKLTNSLKLAGNLKRTIDSSNFTSSETSQTGIDGLIDSEESLHAELNNPNVHNFNSSPNKLITSVIKSTVHMRTIDGCNISSDYSQNEIYNVQQPKDSLHGKQNNLIVNDCNFSSCKIDSMKTLNKANDLNSTIDDSNILSSENCRNGMIESINNTKQNHPTINFFNSSSPKIDYRRRQNLKGDRHLERTIDSCNISSSETSQNGIYNVKQPKDCLNSKPNTPTVNDFNSSPKRDFMKHLKAARDLNRTIYDCNMSFEYSQNELNGVMKSEESLLTKLNNPTTNNTNSSSPKRNFIQSLRARCHEITKNFCYSSVYEKGTNEIDSMIESEEHLLAKPNNRSSPKKDFRNNLNDIDLWKTRDNSNSSPFYNSKTKIGNVKQIEDSLQVEQNSLTVNDLNFSSYKIDFMKCLNKAKDLNITIDNCNILSSENRQNGVDGMMESEDSSYAKQINTTVNDFNSSSPKIDFMKCLNKAKDLNITMDNCNILSSENRQSGVDGMVESEDSSYSKHINTTVNDFNSSSPKIDCRNNLKEDGDLNRTRDGCKTSSSETSQNRIDNLKQLEDILHAKQNTPNANDFNSSSPEKDFAKSLKEVRDLNRILDSCNTLSSENSQNRIDDLTESAESSLVKLNNSTITNFNSSSPKRNLSKSLFVAKYLKRTKSCYNSSPYEKSKNRIDSIIDNEESFPAEESNSTSNKCNSLLPKTDFSPNLKEVNLNSTIDCSNTMSSENSQNIVEGVVESEDSLPAKQNVPTRNRFNSSFKRNLMTALNKARDYKRKIDDIIESDGTSHAKFFSPEKGIWKRVLKKDKNHLKTEFSHSEDALSKKRGGSSTNKADITCNQHAKRKKFDDLGPHFMLNPSKKATSTFENNASDLQTSLPEICESGMGEKTCAEGKEQDQNDSDTLSSTSIKIASVGTFKDNLCPELQDSDGNSNSTSSADNGFPDYQNAILLKLPLRLSFKRTPKKDQDVTRATPTNATVHNISASICKIASVTSLKELDTETASCSHNSLLSNTAAISTDQVLQAEDSTNKDKQTEIVGYNDIAPAISIPITFSLIEEQSTFEHFQTKNTGLLDSGESCVEDPWSNFYSSMAGGTNTAGVKRSNEEQNQNILAKKLRKDDYTLSMEKSGKLTIPSNVSHLFGNRIFIKDMKQLSVRKDGALFLNWKNVNS